MANDKQVESISPEKQEFIWKGPLYTKTAAPVWYYIIIVLIGLILGGVFLWMSQPLSAIVVAASLFFFITHANEVPKALRYTISSRGVAIEESLYQFSTLKSFWISEHPGACTLYVEQAGRFFFPLSIPIRRSDIAGLRTLLRQHIPESKRQGELFMDTIARLTGLL